MQPFEFVNLPRTSSVAGLVTVVASGWFVLAGAAILSDRHSEHTVESARAPSYVAQAVIPDARFTIVVEERRSAAL